LLNIANMMLPGMHDALSEDGQDAMRTTLNGECGDGSA
jgi:hypothetical protein